MPLTFVLVTIQLNFYYALVISWDKFVKEFASGIQEKKSQTL